MGALPRLRVSTANGSCVDREALRRTEDGAGRPQSSATGEVIFFLSFLSVRKTSGVFCFAGTRECGCIDDSQCAVCVAAVRTFSLQGQAAPERKGLRWETSNKARFFSFSFSFFRKKKLLTFGQVKGNTRGDPKGRKKIARGRVGPRQTQKGRSSLGPTFIWIKNSRRMFWKACIIVSTRICCKCWVVPLSSSRSAKRAEDLLKVEEYGHRRVGKHTAKLPCSSKRKKGG